MRQQWMVTLIAVVAAACHSAESADLHLHPGGTAITAAPDGAVQDRIRLAESGGPRAISSAATVVDYASGEPRQLRAGTNGWLCLPDDPATPGDDPMCLDEIWQEWMGAHEQRTRPNIARLGVSYMLRGGKAASNDDPFATAPRPGEAWVDDGPHIMLLVPDPARTLQGMSRDPKSGGPYVMWGNTDYAHVMVPIAPPGGE